MNTLIVTGDMDSLEKRVSDHEIEILYQAKYAPVAEIHTSLTQEEVAELLPEYTISEPKEYNTQ